MMEMSTYFFPAPVRASFVFRVEGSSSVSGVRGTIGHGTTETNVFVHKNVL